MNGLENDFVVALVLAAVQVVGLVSALAARLSEGSLCERVAQALFLVCLGLVGMAAMVSVLVGPGWWLSSGTTFSLMVLGVTCDFTGPRRVKPV